MLGQCWCRKVQFILPSIPQEIANCHCSICRENNNCPWTSFAKFLLSEISFIGEKYIMYRRTSPRAQRAFCSSCSTFLFMHYNHSNNIWVVTDTLNVDLSTVDQYNIYTDTAVIDIKKEKIIYSSFPTISDKLAKGLFSSGFLEPDLQSLGTKGNSIMTFMDNRGIRYYATVKYDKDSNIIDPPDF